MCNQGKQGEMRVTGLISNIGRVKGSSVDFERYSITNTADNGIDICLHHTEDNFKEMIEISEGARSNFSNPSTDTSHKIQTRIDVKTYSGKITKSTMDKFISDIPKSPRIKGHMIMGGAGLTKGAKEQLQNAINSYPDKIIGYISENGIQNLEEAAKLQLENQNKKDKV